MRRRRRLGRALIFIGVALWIPELYIAWAVYRTVTTPMRAANGQLIEVNVHLNGSGWAVAVLWTLLCWLLIGLGIRDLRKRGKD